MKEPFALVLVSELNLTAVFRLFHFELPLSKAYIPIYNVVDEGVLTLNLASIVQGNVLCRRLITATNIRNGQSGIVLAQVVQMLDSVFIG